MQVQRLRSGGGSGRHLLDRARARGELFLTQLCWADGLAEHHIDTPSRDSRNDGSHGRGMLLRGGPDGRGLHLWFWCR